MEFSTDTEVSLSKPKEDASIRPLLEASCSSYVLDCLARLVQLPWIKQEVQLHVSDLRNPIVTALEKIFGHYCTYGTPKDDTILLIGDSKGDPCRMFHRTDKGTSSNKETITPFISTIQPESLLWFLLHRQTNDIANKTSASNNVTLATFSKSKKVYRDDLFELAPEL
jgi:hypothetical protein